MRRTNATNASTAAMNSNWPASTPTLKNSSASGMCPGGQPDFAQRSRKAEPVQQPERERHNPRPALCQSRTALVTTDDLAGHEHDAQGDDRLDRPLRHMHKSERRRRERDAVGDGERGDGLHQLPSAAGDDDQGEDEQQMIHPHQNVLDTELRDKRQPSANSDLRASGITAAGCLRCQALRPRRAIGELHAVRACPSSCFPAHGCAGFARATRTLAASTAEWPRRAGRAS